jgi:UDP-N-acetylmuramoyl-L-alanyl-D-glutamate--2,6-diaminopimelate ligase
MLNLLRKIAPKGLKSVYHRLLAGFAKAYYRSPSERMVVIGVTGTSGKSSVVYLIARMFEKAGFRVGAASTIFFKVGKKEWLNDKKMTMVGRMQLQKLLRDMAKANCQYAVIETSSEGIEQFRHVGINYDVAVLTNLYPEHIEAHGSFENYKAAKLKLFTKLSGDDRKIINNQKVEKVIVVNADDEHAADFLIVPADRKYALTQTNRSLEGSTMLRAEQAQVSPTGVEFQVNQQPFRLRLLGEHSIANALTAIGVGQSQGLSLTSIAQALDQVHGIPGRIEFIDEGQSFDVVVDYAFEPRAMAKLYAVVNIRKPKRIIHVLGGTGGGRDKSRRPKIGALAGEQADVVIVTNEDPYDEDPTEIIQQVAAGAQGAGKKLNQNLFTIMDRRQAIRKALSLARPGDIVLLTGKGSEQAIVGPGLKKTPWDERVVAREELHQLSKTRTRKVKIE